MHARPPLPPWFCNSRREALCPSPAHLPPRSNLRVCKLSKAEAQRFYEVHRGKPFYDTLTDFMSSGRICAMELTGPSAIQAWRQLLGPTDSDAARQQVGGLGHYGFAPPLRAPLQASVACLNPVLPWRATAARLHCKPPLCASEP